MKFSAALLALLGLAAVAQALPSSSLRFARQEEAVAEAAPLVTPVAESSEAGSSPVETGLAALTAEAEKHGHHEHETKPEVHPHPLNWYLIYNAAKALAPVVGGLIEPLLVNIVHGVVGAIVQTINTGFSLPAPPHHYPAHYSHKEPHAHGHHEPHHE